MKQLIAIFWPKSWVNLFGKYSKMRLEKSEGLILKGKKRLFAIEKITKHYFKIIFAQKQKIKNSIFYLKQPKHYFKINFAKKQKTKKCHFLTETMG